MFTPSLEDPDLTEGWAGYYENTLDKNTLLGEASNLLGFFYATGFSGHGFLQAPAVGELMADLYCRKESFMDPAPFNAERLRDGDSRISEINII